MQSVYSAAPADWAKSHSSECWGWCRGSTGKTAWRIVGNDHKWPMTESCSYKMVAKTMALLKKEFCHVEIIKS